LLKATEALLLLYTCNTITKKKGRVYYQEEDIISVFLLFFYTPVVFSIGNLGSLVAYGVPVSAHAPPAAALLGHKAINPPEARVFRLVLALEAAPVVAISSSFVEAAPPAAEELCTANAL
jgi:hypothetical protein